MVRYCHLPIKVIGKVSTPLRAKRVSCRRGLWSLLSACFNVVDRGSSGYGVGYLHGLSFFAGFSEKTCLIAYKEE